MLWCSSAYRDMGLAAKAILLPTLLSLFRQGGAQTYTDPGLWPHPCQEVRVVRGTIPAYDLSIPSASRTARQWLRAGLRCPTRVSVARGNWLGGDINGSTAVFNVVQDDHGVQVRRVDAATDGWRTDLRFLCCSAGSPRSCGSSPCVYRCRYGHASRPLLRQRCKAEEEWGWFRPQAPCRSCCPVGSYVGAWKVLRSHECPPASRIHQFAAAAYYWGLTGREAAERACAATDECKSLFQPVCGDIAGSWFTCRVGAPGDEHARNISASANTPPPAGMVNKGPTGCTPQRQCGLCQGDCDHDGDCQGSLRCFQRDGMQSVPGCAPWSGGRTVLVNGQAVVAGAAASIRGVDFCVCTGVLCMPKASKVSSRGCLHLKGECQQCGAGHITTVTRRPENLFMRNEYHLRVISIPTGILT
eukprot:COSAG01_NODE_996_length_12232_cov_4.146707_1_plen_415_part_00